MRVCLAVEEQALRMSEFVTQQRLCVQGLRSCALLQRRLTGSLNHKLHYTLPRSTASKKGGVVTSKAEKWQVRMVKLRYRLLYGEFAEFNIVKLRRKQVIVM